MTICRSTFMNNNNNQKPFSPFIWIISNTNWSAESFLLISGHHFIFSFLSKTFATFEFKRNRKKNGETISIDIAIKIKINDLMYALSRLRYLFPYTSFVPPKTIRKSRRKRKINQTACSAETGSQCGPRSLDLIYSNVNHTDEGKKHTQKFGDRMETFKWKQIKWKEKEKKKTISKNETNRNVFG